MPWAELLLDLLPFSLRSKDWLLSSIMGRALAANKQAHAWDEHPKTSTHRQCLDYCSLAASGMHTEGYFHPPSSEMTPRTSRTSCPCAAPWGLCGRKVLALIHKPEQITVSPWLILRAWGADVSAGRAYNRHKAGIGKEGPQENKIPRSPWDSFK